MGVSPSKFKAENGAIVDVVFNDHLSTVLTFTDKNNKISRVTLDTSKFLLFKKEHALTPIEENKKLPLPTSLALKNAKRVRPYIEVLEELVKERNLAPHSSETYNLVIQLVNARYPQSDILTTPKRKTLSHWWKNYVDSQHDIYHVLKPSRERCTPDDSKAERLLRNYIERATGNTDKKQKEHHKEYVEKARELGLKHYSISKFNRAIQDISEYVRVMSDPNSSEVLKQSYRYKYVTKVKTSFCLERVEIDASNFNLKVFDENGQAIGPVTIFAAIDCYSKYPLAIHIQYKSGESAEAYQKLYREMISGSSPSLNADGVPMMIVGDNAAGLKAHKTGVIYSSRSDFLRLPPYYPQGKGFIEQFFDMIKENFFEKQPYAIIDEKTGKKIFGEGVQGYTETPTDIKNHTPAEKRASITQIEFERRFHDFLCDYVNTKQASLKNKSPQHVWDEQAVINNFPEPDLCELEHLFHIHSTKRKVRKNGTVFFDNSLYSCPDDGYGLKELFDEYKQKNKDLFVNVLYSIFNVRVVTVVYKPRNSEAISITAHRVNVPDETSEIAYKSMEGLKSTKIEQRTQISYPVLPKKSGIKKADEDKKEKDAIDISKVTPSMIDELLSEAKSSAIKPNSTMSVDFEAHTLDTKMPKDSFLDRDTDNFDSLFGENNDE
ncbi:hypothetical protein [Pseudoalteromonas sp. T1lg24]|uniref:hypothetical protein n=1 Tax=Pseudoalteromonas sp. T1lg24 TaxID=2077099 RepID=UPI000CF679DF|nr:hypothetical protein [Pseudoalteromonas sp. T1lg24]